MPKSDRKTRTLSVFLIKPELRELEEIINLLKGPEPHEITAQGTKLGTLYVVPSKSGIPNWTQIFAPFVDIEQLGVYSASSSAVLLVEGSKRTFALSFGQGRHLLQPGSYEESFGLKVTLNSVDPMKIRSIDRKSFDAISRHTREQASREVGIREFGLDIEQDLLRAVVGKPTDATLGSRLAGMDSLAATVKIGLEDIPAQLERYLKKSSETTYQENFPWVDHIAEVKDRSLKGALDSLLLSKIQSRDFDRLWLAVPSAIDWSDIEGFLYSSDKEGDLQDDLHISAFLETVHIGDLSIGLLKRIKVLAIGAASGQPIDTWPLYKCIYAEIEHGGAIFLLTESSWYRVDKEFTSEVNDFFDRFPRSSIDFPAYADEDEAKYNLRVARERSESFFCMDRKAILYGGGRSSIEFCDLYSVSREMVHVKHYGASSVLSHLFSQGVIPAQLLLLDPKFRKRVNEQVPDPYKMPNPEDALSARDHEVVYAIISRSDKPLTLPFFSRVNLRIAAQRLGAMGYKVSIKKIPVG